MDNLEKLATQVTQNEEKQSKNSTQYVLDQAIVLSLLFRLTNSDYPFGIFKLFFGKYYMHAFSIIE
jgi:hypothetical protein